MRIYLTVLCCTLLYPAAAFAQDANLDLRLPISIISEQSSFDGKSGTFVYRGLQLTQGNISIEAEEGRATIRDQAEGEWQFAGNVSIVVDNGRIECDSAHLVFEQSVLTRATVTGSPASFELKRSNADDVTHAEAGKLDYDVHNGIIEFSDDAVITESGNRIASHFLLYNIDERRIDADSSGAGDDRVRITYTPTNGAGDNTAEDTASEDAENQ